MRRHFILSTVCSLVMLPLAGHGQAPSPISLGGGSCGRLRGGEALPCRGDNFEAFTTEACRLGRNYLHPRVIRTIAAAYTTLAEQQPDRRWQYGDLGWRDGGRLSPHKSHQNGLCADFFMPMSDDAAGEPRLLPIRPHNLYGYGLQLDARGRWESLHIDWSALARHLEALEGAAAQRDVRITRVIIDPRMQTTLLSHLQQPRHWKRRFNRQRAWVRHDEHYHVDFELPAHERRPLQCKK